MESCRKRKRGGAGEHQQSNVVGFQEVPLPAWIDLSNSPLPPGWEQCLDLQSGEVYYVNSATQTRVCGDPRNILSKELAAEQSMVGKGQPGVTPSLDMEMKLPYLATNASTPDVSNGEMLFMDSPNHNNGMCFNSNFNSRVAATGPSSLMTAMTNTNSNMVASNMAATVCLQCHTFVMVSRNSPHCPNCNNFCNVDAPIALGNR